MLPCSGLASQYPLYQSIELFQDSVLGSLSFLWKHSSQIFSFHQTVSTSLHPVDPKCLSTEIQVCISLAEWTYKIWVLCFLVSIVGSEEIIYPKYIRCFHFQVFCHLNIRYHKILSLQPQKCLLVFHCFSCHFALVLIIIFPSTFSNNSSIPFHQFSVSPSVVPRQEVSGSHLLNVKSTSPSAPHLLKEFYRTRSPGSGEQQSGFVSFVLCLTSLHLIQKNAELGNHWLSWSLVPLDK